MVLLHLLLGVSTRIFFPGSFVLAKRMAVASRGVFFFSTFAWGGYLWYDMYARVSRGAGHRRRLRFGLVGWGVTSRQRLHERQENLRLVHLLLGEMIGDDVYESSLALVVVRAGFAVVMLPADLSKRVAAQLIEVHGRPAARPGRTRAFRAFASHGRDELGVSRGRRARRALRPGTVQSRGELSRPRLGDVVVAPGVNLETGRSRNHDQRVSLQTTLVAGGESLRRGGDRERRNGGDGCQRWIEREGCLFVASSSQENEHVLRRFDRRGERRVDAPASAIPRARRIS